MWIRIPACGTEKGPSDRSGHIREGDQLPIHDGENAIDRFRHVPAGISDTAAPSARAVRARVTECCTFNLPALSERLADTEVPDDTRLELATDFSTVHLEPDVDSDRSHRRTVPQTETNGASQIAEIEVGHPVEDVAAIRKESRSDFTPHRHAQLAVENQHGIPATREPTGADSRARADGVEREAADRRVASGEEALARREVVVTTISPESARPGASTACPLGSRRQVLWRRGSRERWADGSSAAETEPAGRSSGNRPPPEAGGRGSLRTEVAATRLDTLWVSRVARGERRQPHLRKTRSISPPTSSAARRRSVSC